MGTQTASPRGHYGEQPSAWPVSEAYMQKHNLLASDSLWRHYRHDHSMRRENTSSTSDGEVKRSKPVKLSTQLYREKKGSLL